MKRQGDFTREWRQGERRAAWPPRATGGDPPAGLSRGDARAGAPPDAAMGITRIANVTGLDSWYSGGEVVPAQSRSLAVSQGKGLDLAPPRVSGLMEAVEGYHAERITLPLKLRQPRGAALQRTPW